MAELDDEILKIYVDRRISGNDQEHVLLNDYLRWTMPYGKFDFSDMVINGFYTIKNGQGDPVLYARGENSKGEFLWERPLYMVQSRVDPESIQGNYKLIINGGNLQKSIGIDRGTSYSNGSFFGIGNLMVRGGNGYVFDLELRGDKLDLISATDVKVTMLVYYLGREYVKGSYRYYVDKTVLEKTVRVIPSILPSSYGEATLYGEFSSSELPSDLSASTILGVNAKVVVAS